MPKFQCPFRKTYDYSYVISKEKPTSPTALAYLKAVDNLLYANLDLKYKIISVISTMKNDHQANQIVNLAYLLHERKQKALVIDLDFRTPRLQVVLKSGMDQGIYDHLFKGLPLEKIISKDKTYGFDYLLVGREINSITQVLESNKVYEMIASLKPNYDVILLISPSMANSKDGITISKLSDAILYLVSKKYSNKQVVDLSHYQLKQLNLPILGSLLVDYQEKEKLLGIPLL